MLNKFDENTILNEIQKTPYIFGILCNIQKVADSLQYPCYVVGGYVRDLFLERKNKDIDVVVVGSGKKMADAVAKVIGGSCKVTIYESYGTAQIVTQDGTEIEFVGARKEFYHRESRNPIVENGTLDDDIQRRDLTWNAMAICLNSANYGKLIDKFNGLDDLKNKIVRCVGDANERFSEDPLRMLRTIRFATRFGFTIEENTYQAIVKQCPRIEIITKERILDELNKMIMSDKPSQAFIHLSNTRLLHFIFPELEALEGREVSVTGKYHKDVFAHTLQVLDNVASMSDDIYLRWAALFHDIGKPKSKKFIDGNWTFFNHEHIGSKMIPKIFRRMAFPQDSRMLFVQKMVDLHMRPMTLCEEGVTDSAVRRILFDAGEDIDSLMILCKADITSKHQDKIDKFRQNYEKLQQRMVELEESDKLRNFQPPIKGDEIMEMFNLTPCKTVGLLKEAVKNAILDGIIPNEYEQAKQFVIEKYKEMKQ